MGDNIDHEIHARVQSQQHCNRSIHWTHQFAVFMDRVQDPQLDRFSSQKPVSETQFAELLPDNDVMANLVRNWSVIVSRVITKYLQPFRQLRDVIVRPIPHEYSKEMSQKSDSVSSSFTTVSAVTLFLGLQLTNCLGFQLTNCILNFYFIFCFLFPYKTLCSSRKYSHSPWRKGSEFHGARGVL